MPELDGTVEFSVQCDKCGADMDSMVDVTRLRGIPLVLVPPCRSCEAETRSAAHEAGVDEGYTDGYKDGNAHGARTIQTA